MTDSSTMPTLSPYLSCENAAEAIAFYERAFGAREVRARLTAPGGEVMNAELAIGDCRFMVSSGSEALGSPPPSTLGGTSVVLHLMVDDADAAFARAIEAGCTERIALSDQFYGHRTGRLEDPYGHAWILAQEIERVPEEEMVRRFEALFSQQ